MLKLSAPRGNWDIELPQGAVLHLRAIEPADTLISRNAAFGLSVGIPETERGNFLTAAFTQVLLTRVLVGWEGIGDAQDNPAEITSATVSALLAIPTVYDRVEEKLIGPLQLRVQEKNASSLSPNGTSEGASKAVPSMAAGGPIAGSA